MWEVPSASRGGEWGPGLQGGDTHWDVCPVLVEGASRTGGLLSLQMPGL